MKGRQAVIEQLGANASPTEEVVITLNKTEQMELERRILMVMTV